MSYKLPIAVITAGVLFGYAQPAKADLALEGQGGVFLNTYAYSTAQNKIEAATHYVDLGSVGHLNTYSVTGGLKGNIEVGYTRLVAKVPGVNDQNILHAKWQFLKEDRTKPAVAVWGIERDVEKSSDSLDIGVTATKFEKFDKYPVLFNLGLRSTKAQGIGLFGYGSRKLKWEGAIAVAVHKQLVIGTEFKEQIGGRTWTDLAARYSVNERFTLDAGLANLGPGINHQVAFGLTYKP